MIVYGDPSFCGSLDRLIHEAAGATRNRPKDARLDAARDLLIRMGRIEQAAEDASDLPGALLALVRAATDRAADAFHAVWAGRADAGARWRDAIGSAAGLASNGRVPDVPVRVKVPEGFAFYTLYPEQYAAAAAKWIDERSSDRERPEVLVLGIRSIGTSLSAVVRQSLVSAGWNAHRWTVRPYGHPYDRRVELAPQQVRGAGHVIIVDEGPGISGSSMASAARAIVAAGIDPACVSFFPGHGAGPGGAASPEVRRCWQMTRRYVVPTGQLRWSGRLLLERLADETSRLLDGARVERVEDLSGGLWRWNVSRAADASFPPAFPAFERAKYRCVTGDGRSVLWKFAGLGGGADQLMRQLGSRAAGGATPAPIATAMGFVAFPWVHGRPLDRTDASEHLLMRIGRYIAAAKGPALTSEERSAGFNRLREILYWNTWESLGEPAAEATRSVADAAFRVVAEQPMDAYGDGRLGPYEWVRTSSGQIVKLDGAGHDADHTVIGKQPVAWDVAGATVEWELDDSHARALQAAAGVQGIPRELSAFYHASYAAFRVGMASICGVDAATYLRQLRRIQR